MDSVQNVGAPLANTVSGWWGCSLQVGSYILCLLAQRSSDTSEPVSNVPTVQDDQFPALNAGLNATEVEFGVCSVTCGIGIREVLLTSGCPGTEEKCIVRVEECQGPVDCGWGIPIPEDPTCVKMPCISIPPENQFTYTWKMLIANKTSHLLLNDSAVLKVCRDTHSLIFQCETQKNGNTIASVKYRVYAATGMQTIKPKTIEMNPSSKTMLDAILVFCVITGFIVIALEIFAMIFIVVFWGVLKSVWQLKSEQDKKLANKK
nr:sperm acrosome membrane-associated protein 1 isoform X1 [Columba livia]